MVSTVTETTTGAVSTTEEVKTTTVTTPAAEELTTVTKSVPLVSTTPGYCLQPMDEAAGLQVQQAADGKSSIDKITGTWNVPAPITQDTDRAPKLATDFSKPSVVNGIRLTNVADAAGVVPLQQAVLSFIVSYRSPGDDRYVQVQDQATGKTVSSGFLFRQDTDKSFALTEQHGPDLCSIWVLI